MSEVSFEGIRPPARFGAWLSLLSQNCKDGGRGLPERARAKKSKAANSVLIAFRNVLRPTINELFQRALHVNPATQLLVLEPEREAVHGGGPGARGQPLGGRKIDEQRRISRMQVADPRILPVLECMKQRNHLLVECGRNYLPEDNQQRQVARRNDLHRFPRFTARIDGWRSISTDGQALFARQGPGTGFEKIRARATFSTSTLPRSRLMGNFAAIRPRSTQLSHNSRVVRHPAAICDNGGDRMVCYRSSLRSACLRTSLTRPNGFLAPFTILSSVSDQVSVFGS